MLAPSLEPQCSQLTWVRMNAINLSLSAWHRPFGSTIAPHHCAISMGRDTSPWLQSSLARSCLGRIRDCLAGTLAHLCLYCSFHFLFNVKPQPNLCKRIACPDHTVAQFTLAPLKNTDDEVAYTCQGYDDLFNVHDAPLSG